MNSYWQRVVSVGIALGITLSVSLTVLLVFGWKNEKETAVTQVSFKTDFEFSRSTGKQTQQGTTLPLQTSPESKDVPSKTPDKPAPTRHDGEVSSPYVGGNSISEKSGIRYVIDDDKGDIKMFGFDVMRGQSIFVGSGRMVGRRLIIPRFYSFLDDTYGTLKLDLSEDEKTFEGYFEGHNPTQEARVVLVRLP